MQGAGHSTLAFGEMYICDPVYFSFPSIQTLLHHAISNSGMYPNGTSEPKDEIFLCIAPPSAMYCCNMLFHLKGITAIAITMLGHLISICVMEVREG